MKIIHKISVIWLNRKQNLKQSTEDLVIFLERLKKFDPRLTDWYLKGMSRKEGQKTKVPFEYEFIKNHFYESDKYREKDFPEFSFLISFWNGAPVDSLSYDIRASLGGEGKLGSNNCVLTFPYEGEIYNHYCIKENWEKLLELFVDHWKPDQYRDFEGNLVGIIN